MARSKSHTPRIVFCHEDGDYKVNAEARWMWSTNLWAMTVHVNGELVFHESVADPWNEANRLMIDADLARRGPQVEKPSATVHKLRLVECNAAEG